MYSCPSTSSTAGTVPKETSSLLVKKLKCYSLRESHCEIYHGFHFDYIRRFEIQKLTTARVFFCLAGTVLLNVILWFETLIIAGVFWLVWFSLVYCRLSYGPMGLAEFVGKESNIRSFLLMFTMFVGLLLSFYTMLNINRWADMRRLGVGGMWQASSKLSLQISQGVTRDPEVLDAIPRYAAASLSFVYLRRRGMEEDLDPLVTQGLLTEAECRQMATIPSPQRAEAIWTWLGAMVSTLHAQKLVNGPPHYASLMNTVDEGRRGAAIINTYLDTPIPLGYVHMLGLIVKLHNVLVAILIAMLSAKHATRGDELGAFRTMVRAFLIPFFYNAILMINNEMTDPFDGDMTGFPLRAVVCGIQDDAKSIVCHGTAESLPRWLTQERKYKKWKEQEEAAAAV